MAVSSGSSSALYALAGRPAARIFSAVPAKKGSPHHAAPTFEFHRFRGGASKKDQLIAICDALLGPFPALGGDDGVRHLLGKLPSV
jgi:hypothetical protein